MTDDPAARRPWWTVALGAAVVLFVIVAVSGAIGQADLHPADGDAGCEADDCEAWRVDLGGGRVRTTERFAVHERRGTLTVVSLEAGSVAWRHELDRGSPSELYADDEVIVVVHPEDGDTGVHLTVLGTATGRPGLDRTYDEWATASDIHRVRGELSLSATPVRGGPASSRMLVPLAGGDVRVLVSGPHTVIRGRDRLLVWTADEIIGLTDGGDATVDWRAQGELVDVDLTGDRVLLRTPADDEYQVRAISSGAAHWSTPDDGVSQAQFVGTWVGLTSETGMAIVDPADGTVRFERDDVAATTRVAHLALERYTVVAWPSEPGIDLAAYDPDGIEVFSRALPGADAAAAWTTFAPVAGRPDMVQVVGDAGRRSTWLDLPSGEVVRAAVDGDPGPWDRDFRDGLLWRSRNDQLVIEGPSGSLAIDGMTTVVSVDPLVIHGPDGLARLEPGPVLGPDG